MKYKDFKIALFKKGEENKEGKKKRISECHCQYAHKKENPHKGK